MSKRRGAATNSPASDANSVPGVWKNISKPSKCSSTSTKLQSDGTEMPTIQLRTEIPGPRSRALMARREAAVPRGEIKRANARQRTQENHHRQHWRGSGGECRQNCSRLHQAPSGNLF